MIQYLPSALLLETGAPSLPEKEVHVWSLSLSISREARDEFGRVLSEDERQRVARLRFPELKDRFVVAHGALRYLLGAYLNKPPTSVRFEQGPHGKPRVESAISFNLSHSDDRAAIAVTRGAEVGIDVERLRSNDQMAQIARDYFSLEEASLFSCAPRTQRARTFLEIWTRKEAFTKAVGLGLAYPLAKFSIPFRSGEPAPVVAELEPHGAWMTRSVMADDDYVTSLAYRPDANVRCSSAAIPADELLQVSFCA